MYSNNILNFQKSTILNACTKKVWKPIECTTYTHTHTHTHTHIYIYIYIVLFGPVKSELGVIPSGQENYSRAEHLNFPGSLIK